MTINILIADDNHSSPIQANNGTNRLNSSTTSIELQYQIFQSLRDFIFRFGSAINFNMKDYQHVLFCIHLKQFKKSETNSTSTSKNDTKFKDFQLTKHGQYYMIDIVYPFKPKMLNEFISNELPCANDLLGNEYDDIM